VRHDGTGLAPIPLPNRSAEIPAVSRDGRFVAYRVWDLDGDKGVYVAPVAGGTPTAW
jgi:hypothetical protein